MSVSVGVGVNVGCVSVMSMEVVNGEQWEVVNGCQWGRFFLTTIERVDFVEFVGATNNELLALKNKELDVKTLYSKIGSDVTDYKRESVI